MDIARVHAVGIDMDHGYRRKTDCDDLTAALQRSPVAFAYFDGADRLRFWNQAYVDLNFAIPELIREGAVFADLLAELILRGQIDVPTRDMDAWIAHRVERRRQGGTDIRNLSDGRTFIVEECHDEVGGTLGFWIDVSHLLMGSSIMGDRQGRQSVSRGLSDHGCQNVVRNHLQRVLGALELLKHTGLTTEGHALIDEGVSALGVVRDVLDRQRARPPDHGKGPRKDPEVTMPSGPI